LAFNTHIVAILLFLLPLNDISGQEFVFSDFTENEKMANGGVRSILKDHIGYLWVGTNDGLNQFAGNEIVVHRSLKVNNHSISDNGITKIRTSPEGEIWVGTEFGLNRYDFRTGKFHRYINEDSRETTSSANFIQDIEFDKNNRIWIATYTGIFHVNPLSGEFEKVKLLESGSNNIAAWSLLNDENGNIWCATNSGLFILNEDFGISSSEIVNYKYDAEDLNSIASDYVWGLDKDKNGNIWMGSFNGLSRSIGVNIADLKFKRITPDQEIANNLDHYKVNAIHIDDENRLWVGTFDGGAKWSDLNNFENDEISFQHITSEPSRPNSIASNEILDVFSDSTGVLWIGTSAGLNKYDPVLSNFKTIKNAPERAKSLNQNIVQTVLVDSDGNTWVGTKDKGINVSENLNDDEFRHLNKHSRKTFLSDQIFDVYEDSHGYIWVATYSGIQFIHKTKKYTDEWQHINHQNGLVHNFCYSIYQEKEGVYWVATYGGLSKMLFHPNASAEPLFFNYESDESNPKAHVNSCTYTIEQDKYGAMWFGTFSGLSKFIPESEEDTAHFQVFKEDIYSEFSLSNKSVHKLHLDSKERLWVGTSNGINLVLDEEDSDEIMFKSFGIQEGLPNSFIADIVEDHKGRLWLSTNLGIVIFNPDSAIYAKNKNNIVEGHYTSINGLQGNQFGIRASYSSGTQLFFGGSNGLNICQPDNFRRDLYQPMVTLRNLWVSNEIISAGDTLNNRILLGNNISNTSELDLKWHENSIGFDIACLNYSLPEKNTYQWRLTGSSSEWIKSNTSEIRFNELKPGDYSFSFKASNSSGVWSKESEPLFIRIAPPPWQSLWAYISYGLLAFLFCIFFIRFRTQRKIKALERKRDLEIARLEEREKLRAKSAQDFHDDLGHNLTKISLYSELLSRNDSGNAEQANVLMKINANVKDLSNGIRDFIWTFDVKKDSLKSLLVRLQEFGDQIFQDSEIDFRVDLNSKKHEEKLLDPEFKRQVLLFFKEAMNNALKHSKAQKVLFKSKVEDDKIILSLLDNGIGFDPNKVIKGYGLNNMSDRMKSLDVPLNISSSKEGTKISIAFENEVQLTPSYAG